MGGNMPPAPRAFMAVQKVESFFNLRKQFHQTVIGGIKRVPVFIPGKQGNPQKMEKSASFTFSDEQQSFGKALRSLTPYGNQPGLSFFTCASKNRLTNFGNQGGHGIHGIFLLKKEVCFLFSPSYI
ncbi:MAG TPA: hypothetical protein DD454_01540 [Candidatus Moranbacteria bacterium]|nr:hypothetical protein [Candidatus Moranbacteria bacterium]